MKLKYIFLIVIVFAIASIANTSAQAQDAQVMDLVKNMQKQMLDMQKMIDQQAAKIKSLEGSAKNIQIAAPAAEPAAPMSDYEFATRLDSALGGANKWLKDVKAGGDLRLRYEAFQHTSGNTAETDDRNRFRYRLRYGLEKKFSDEIKAGFSLASGEVRSGSSHDSATGLNGDPTSTNTTFDNLFNFKDIFVEKAFGSYAPNWAKVGPISGVELTGGKFTNPFEKGSSDLIWDRDVKPEGAYETVNFKLMETPNFKLNGYATAGQYILDEDSSGSDNEDAEMFGYQFGINPVIYTPMFDRPFDLLSAVSYYNYSDFDRQDNWKIGDTGGLSLARGNSTCTSKELCTGFKVIDIYNELSFYPFGDTPVRPYYDYAYNTADGQSTFDQNAWALGVKIGKLVTKGDWETSFAWKNIGRDAIPGFNDSDFTGATTTHTGTQGLVTKAGYMLRDNMSLNAAAFFLENQNAGSVVAGSTIRDEQQRRFQLDVSWKF
ncbi:MAG: hypothetical protein A3G33_07710 [Omnitrophica bacterium RIFCSPLOWO2_12_FULL_44_17]|uniref:Porin n=1 Tax=Candidatus Danuiimicrobium aquiferis TaxID=1801832 RepID=A0A1G1L1T2_9BACT|nr:MAG: hypothetical protein A3B72_02265 [Omnitrophica bacterium RIFCSPHIGHO2_02_FULL_45_28]OGW88887.1 MAG: hypothetical protein A3E74_10225 [Omnitrophica bacterium RIFCSPHIGHO2_12_FULL_44_12]OGW99112.1 MAG: hypothetical protein A3G33_07710 [Omnitrophica bacterium RIFCSPLOWO2_12_FULL_44_17]OGX02607.1 MAG: hypothetical protein A3J12_01945 [Omnitrophica bacterium RIFCSPLOWO2_02_FULL_44_11]